MESGVGLTLEVGSVTAFKCKLFVYGFVNVVQKCTALLFAAIVISCNVLLK